VPPVFNLTVKFDANTSSITDIAMAALRLRRFGCVIPIQANFGEFLQISNPDIVTGLCDPLLEFWDHFYISGMIEARNFDYRCHCRLVLLLTRRRSLVRHVTMCARAARRVARVDVKTACCVHV